MSMGFIVVILALLANTLKSTSKIRVIPNEKLLTIQIQELLQDATTAIDYANKKQLFKKGIIPLGTPIPISLDDDTTLNLTISDYSSFIQIFNKDAFIEYMNGLGVEDPYLLYDIVSGVYDSEILRRYPHFVSVLSDTNHNPKKAFILALRYYIKLSSDQVAKRLLYDGDIMTMLAYKKIPHAQLCQLNGVVYGYQVNIEFLYNTKKKEIDEISFTYHAKNS